jgi:3-deoxy-D-manno-octulosonic-acid transferase
MSFFASAQRPLYNLFLRLYKTTASLASALGNEKAAKWIKGQENLFQKIESDLAGRKGERIWMHCASLGEFEQGRPLLEMVRKEYPHLTIILTFFSPSGYEVRKNYHHADLVCYLPFDSRKNAGRFLEIVNPKIAIFVKYEFWYHYLKALHERQIPTILISGIFRKTQPFFQWYGALHREMLSKFSHLFVQDEDSIRLLQSIRQQNITRIPDTRIDRVSAISANAPALPSIEEFLDGQKAWIGGSIYAEENELLLTAFRKGLLGDKLILAPHNVNEPAIEELIAPWGEDAMRYTRMGTDIKSKRVLVIDTIGILSSLYRHGTGAFIGGGFGKGIHNILEPAAFGIPIVFGPNYHKFREAEILIEKGGAFSVNNEAEFLASLETLSNTEVHMNAGAINQEYIEENTGGSKVVFEWVKGNIDLTPSR